MEKINQKLAILEQALSTLDESIVTFNAYEKKFLNNPETENEKLAISMRDSMSMIQRFEYCTDLFWKVLKLYLEEVEKMEIEIPSARGVLRDATKIKIISENEGERCIEMVVNRNKTSHIYHHEMAEIIAHKVPEFYGLMQTIVDRLGKRVAGG
jgi:nucleotidyltransferase substrate binding protein (TIGR01987 family)